MIERTPIYVVYKRGQKGRKIMMKEFLKERNVDRILNPKIRLFPANAVLLDIGVGRYFKEKYEKKYKLNGYKR